MISLAFLLAYAQGDVGPRWTSNDGSMQASGFTSGFNVLLDNSTGGLKLSGKGTPCIVVARASGMSLSANSQAITALPSKNGPMVLTSGRAVGNSKLVMDSSVRDKFLVVPATKSELAPSKSRTEVDTEQFDYVGNATEGTITCANPFVMTSHEESLRVGGTVSKVLRISTTQDLTLHGTSGTLVIDPGRLAKRRLKSGVLSGPITFHWVRSEINLDEITEAKSSINGSCDHVRIESDASGETVFAEGNVVFDYSGPAGTIHNECVLLKFSLDLNQKPLEASGGGSAAVSRVTLPRKGGKS